jgi:hypothetical protein
MKATSLLNSFAATLALAGALPALAQETSIRASAWSGDRSGSEDEDPTFNLELWGRGAGEIAENIEVRAEGWAATDPTGDGDPALELREAYVAWRSEGVRLAAGRQVFSWGRADRLNPTDVFSARDHRRLVEDENDMRLGILAATAEMDVADGTLTLVWAPEFRTTTLPQRLGLSGVPLLHDAPNSDESQFAVRYEQFGSSFDWSVTYAEALDRNPWVTRTGPPGAPAITLVHPRLRMLGGDIATTLGDVGVRAEAAIYDYESSRLNGFAARVPRFALALGADRDFPNQININVQALVRANENLAIPPDALGPVARANGTIQYTWRDTVIGGLIRVRRLFDADRGAIEASAGGFSGGGRFEQLKASYAIADGIRLTLLAERYSGAPETQLGRLSENSLITVGIRYGF